jgi:hypothetical protein
MFARIIASDEAARNVMMLGVIISISHPLCAIGATIVRLSVSSTVTHL